MDVAGAWWSGGVVAMFDEGRRNWSGDVVNKLFQVALDRWARVGLDTCLIGHNLLSRIVKHLQG